MPEMMVDAALRYLALDLAPLPCHEKSALVPWRNYQQKLPSEQEVRDWFGRWPDANIALVLPPGSLVVDLDGPEAKQLLIDAGITLSDTAPRVRTGKGEHIYLRTGGYDVQNKVALLKKNGSQVDIRAHGGYVLAPPSLHPNGSRYVWENELSRQNLPPVAPQELLQQLNGSFGQRVVMAAQAPTWVSEALRGVGDGERDVTATRLAGYFLSKDIPAEIVLSVLEPFAGQCRPPMSQRDLFKVVSSISAREAGQKRDRDLVAEHIGEVVERTLKQIEDPIRRSGVVSNFASLNRFIPGGFVPGDFVLLGARPATGKTAVALDFARSAARNGKNTVFISREMLVTALCRRMLAQEGHIDATKLKMGLLPSHEVSPVAAKLASLPIWLTDSAQSTSDIKRICEGLGVSIDFLIVDYLQLLQPSTKVVDTRQRVEMVSQELKNIATTMEVPLLCLSSLSRPSNQAPNAPPDLSRLRDSGELEHDADIVIFLHRPSMIPEEVDAIVAKNREGAVGTARLRFKPEWVSFFDDIEEITLDESEDSEREAR